VVAFVVGQFIVDDLLDEFSAGVGLGFGECGRERDDEETSEEDC